MSTSNIAHKNASWQVCLGYDIPHSTSEMNKWCEKFCADWWIYLGTAYKFGSKDDAVAFYMAWGQNMHYAYLNPVTDFDDVNRWLNISEWCCDNTLYWRWDFENGANNPYGSRRRLIFKSESDLALYKLTWE